MFSFCNDQVARLSTTALSIDKLSSVLVEAMLLPPVSSSSAGRERDFQINLATIAQHTMGENSDSSAPVSAEQSAHMQLGAVSSGATTVKLSTATSTASGSPASEGSPVVQGSLSDANSSEVEPAFSEEADAPVRRQRMLAAVDADTLAATLTKLQIPASDLVQDQKAPIGAGGFAKVR